MSKDEVRRPFSFLITVLAGASVLLLIRQLKNHSLDTRYSARVALTVIVSVILEPFRWWENIMWKRRIRKTVMKEPPVFIIGFWRSGTTQLQNLLCQAPEASYITTYQTVFPNLLGHSWWFQPIIGRFWPTHRPLDDVKMGMDLPQEEEIALSNLQEVSFYNFLYFPKDFERFYKTELFMESLGEKQIQRWKTEYLKMIKKSFLNTKGRRFISKSPSNIARIDKILEIFPDARFIFIYRDPYKTVESFYRFFHAVMPVVQVQGANEELTRQRMARVYGDLIRKYYHDKGLIPARNLVEIRFEDFRKDPLSGIRQIYEHFGISGFEDGQDRFSRYLEEISDFRQGQYEVQPETIRWVNEYAGDIVERFEYPKKA